MLQQQTVNPRKNRILKLGDGSSREGNQFRAAGGTARSFERQWTAREKNVFAARLDRSEPLVERSVVADGNAFTEIVYGDDFRKVMMASERRIAAFGDEFP